MIKMVDKNGKEFFECSEAEARVVKKKILNKRNNVEEEENVSIFKSSTKGLTKNKLKKDINAIINSKFDELNAVDDNLMGTISDGFMELQLNFILVDYVLCSYATYKNIRKELKDDPYVFENKDKDLLSAGLLAVIFKANLVVVKDLDDKTILISGIDKDNNNELKVVKLNIK